MHTSPRPTAVVAGGSAGIGRATVIALIDRGYRVAVLARGEGRLEEMEREFAGDVWTRSLDVSDGGALMEAAQAIAAEVGIPEIWVNSAMLTSFSPFAQVDEAEFRAITDTTYLGTVNGCRAALSVMARGNIVNVGSGLAYVSVPNQAAYCGAKHAVEGFTQAIRIEVAQAGRPIHFSMVQLPAVNTPQFDWAVNRMDRHPQPAPPIYQPEVAARAILRAIDTDAREIIVGKSVLKLMIGNMLAPSIVDAQLKEMGVSAQKDDSPPDGRPGNISGPDPRIPSTAHGSFDDRASESGLIVDGDIARTVAIIGGAAVFLGVGLLIGRGLRTREDVPAVAQQDRTRAIRHG